MNAGVRKVMIDEALRSERMTTDQAAAFLGETAEQLRRWRSDGRGGPPYVKRGRRVIYVRAWLERWAAGAWEPVLPGACGNRRSSGVAE